MKSIFKKIISRILIEESKIILKKYKPQIISITGSVGKTSTKDAVFSAISKDIYVRKSEKSFNSELGLPLTILGCQNGWNDPFIWLQNIFHGIDLILFKSNYPKCLVLEIGADHPGDIESISKWLKSDIVIITKISEIPVHVEFFPSPEELLKEKSYLINTLKEEGTLILFADDKRVNNLSSLISTDSSKKVINFGFSDFANIRAINPSVFYDENKIPEGMSFALKYKNEEFNLKIKKILGIHHIYPILASAAVASVFSLPIKSIINSLENYIPPLGRMNIIKGIKNTTLIDDTYNASPDAMYEGLESLASLQVSGKRIAVLGDMMELGSFSSEEHKKIGIKAIQSCDILITIGQRSKFMSEKSKSFDDIIEASEYIKSIIGDGDVIFIKGSQSMRLEKITKMLLREPDKANELIVRQESEWLAKK